MWCRFLTFCVLVSFILFVVASCIYGRPSFHLFFHRCCGDDIENDQVIYENFGNNFLKERLVGGDIIEADNETLFENEDIGRITDEMKEVLSINDPEVKKWIAGTQIIDSATSDIFVHDKISVEQSFDVVQDKREEKNKEEVRNDELLQIKIEDVTETVSTLLDTDIGYKKEVKEMHDGVRKQVKNEQNRLKGRSYELLEDKADVTETGVNRAFLNAHDGKHKQMVGSIRA